MIINVKILWRCWTGVDADSTIRGSTEIFLNISDNQPGDSRGRGKFLVKGCVNCWNTSFQFIRLYRGLSTPLCTVALTNAVTFGVYGIMSRNHGNAQLGDIARNGTVAGFIRVINHKFIALAFNLNVLLSRHLLSTRLRLSRSSSRFTQTEPSGWLLLRSTGRQVCKGSAEVSYQL